MLAGSMVDPWWGEIRSLMPCGAGELGWRMKKNDSRKRVATLSWGKMLLGKYSVLELPLRRPSGDVE